jgi:hypothetical protein
MLLIALPSFVPADPAAVVAAPCLHIDPVTVHPLVWAGSGFSMVIAWERTTWK